MQPTMKAPGARLVRKKRLKRIALFEVKIECNDTNQGHLGRFYPVFERVYPLI
jgi:hypothetical protein